MYQASWAVIKWGEDSQVMIVRKVVNKNLFLQPLSENLWTAGSNSVPILSAAMGIFFKIGHWTWIPTFERVRSPASLSSEAGNLSRLGQAPTPPTDEYPYDDYEGFDDDGLFKYDDDPRDD